MSTKRFKEIKNLSVTELAVKIRESEGQLFQTKLKKATGQLEDTAMIWRLRKDIARMKMLQGRATAPGVSKSTMATKESR